MPAGIPYRPTSHITWSTSQQAPRRNYVNQAQYAAHSDYGARNLKQATDQHPRILKTNSEAHFSARDTNDRLKRRHDM